MENKSCIFCKICAKEMHSKIILENDLLLVIEDVKPISPVHLLLIPKFHVKSMFDPLGKTEGLPLAYFDMVLLLGQRYGENFTIVINTGALAGQSVFHLHWHFLAGRNLYENGFFP